MAIKTVYKWEIPDPHTFGDDKNKWRKWVEDLEIEEIKSPSTDEVKKLKEENRKLKNALKNAIAVFKARLREILINDAKFPEEEADEIINNTFRKK